jgi:uncharacterized membrane protein YphA (DoxX/SURF4 family)
MKFIKKYYSLFLRITVAIIYIQTLYFKFTAHPDSVYIFTKMGVEPFGRIFLGVIELIISIGILMPKTKYVAIVMSIVIVLGALMSHIFILGIIVNGDNGLLFSLACLIFLLSIILFIYHYNEIKLKANRILSLQ